MDIDFKNLKINALQPVSNFEKNILFFIKEWFSETQKVKIQTSGSTGNPKIFFVEKKKMEYSANRTVDFLQLKEGELALLCLPIEYVSGKMMIVRAVQRNLKIKVVTPCLNPLESIDGGIDFCAMTPLQVEHSLNNIHLIKNLIIGGAAVSENLKNKIHQQLQKKDVNVKIFETYGMSETLSHIALKQIYPKNQDYFEVLDSISISQDKRGCLVIFAPKIHDEKLYTNDIVELRNHKEFKFLGRIDHVINSGGVKIFPEELEGIVKKELENEVVFIGVKDETLGERLILVVEGVETSVLLKKIHNVFYAKSYYKPKSIVFINKIPRTENGKVNRLALKEIIV